MFRTLAVLSLAALALATPKAATVITAADEKAYLTAHNTIRAQHNATALVWNQTLSNAAASWAGKCVFQHSGGSLGPYGENIAAGTGETPAQAVGAWTSEESQYNSSNPQPSHYTQVIWKGSKQLGCAYVNCTAGTIFPAMYGQTPFHICEYYPAGNVIGWFSENVQ